jgi:hypothetical protein
MPLQDRQQIEQLLDAMRRVDGSDAGRLDACRRLFAQLNYDSCRKPIRVDLPADVKKQIADAPVIMATAGADQAFVVIHTQLSTPNLPRATERALVGALLKQHPYALFVFSNKDQSHWHLLNVKIARNEASDENRDAKVRRLFRRISIGPGDRLRTAIERIEKIDIGILQGDPATLSPLSIQAAHDDAFDVEAVTKEFFREYRRIFEMVEDLITGIRGPEKRRLFTQRLFNRLMFIAFIQRKGWLKFPGMAENDYLDAIRRDYQTKKKDDSNFYADRLYHLFFRGLNNASHLDMLATNRQRSAPDSFLQRRIGDVPYLNGGLFEKTDDGTDEIDSGIAIPDRAVKAVLGELFARFNFTVTESTPLDVEVAVDPEMLGKVFEELVTGRHESGSYYTPKPIVSFMCREALKGYLETKCPSESKDAIARFVDEHDASGLRDGEAVLDALKNVKCCDPACGSGAYLLGMMHELLDLRACLFAMSRKLDPIKTYERKLEIIQTNVYGVDIDPFAVNIARLRLWLSLAVDFEGDAPPPLPNLDFKIESGDSLAAPDPSDAGQLQLQKQLVDEFLALKREFIMSHSARKKELKKQIETLREKIRAWTHTSGALPENAFDWQVEFAEVFIGNGFDVVLANPPYVRMELIKPLKPLLRQVYPKVHSERADLYCYFYARAVELLAVAGTLSFISSNKWLRAKYGRQLRSFLIEQCEVEKLIDFGDLPVFETAVSYPMIFVAARRRVAQQRPVFAHVRSLEAPYPDIGQLLQKCGTRLPSSALGDADWRLADAASIRISEVMESRSVPLREYVRGEIFYGIKTGLNGAFFITSETRQTLIEDCPQARSVIKPLAVGDDVRRWVVRPTAKWLLYMQKGLDVSELKPVLRHLSSWRAELDDRATRQMWYELQQPQAAYAKFFDKPKIVYPIICAGPRFAFDQHGHFVNDKTFVIPCDDPFLLAVLNSKPLWNFATQICSPLQNGFFEMREQHVSRFPIPRATQAEKMQLAELARHCVAAQGKDCGQWEKEIDERVAALYGL